MPHPTSVIDVTRAASRHYEDMSLKS